MYVTCTNYIKIIYIKRTPLKNVKNMIIFNIASLSHLPQFSTSPLRLVYSTEEKNKELWILPGLTSSAIKNKCLIFPPTSPV